MVDKAERIDRFPAKPDIFHDGPMKHGIKFLVYHRDTHPEGFRRRIFGSDRTVEENFAFARMVDAGDAFHQRRFACAVFAHQRMNFSRQHFQLHARQSAYAGKYFDYVIHFQKKLFIRHRRLLVKGPQEESCPPAVHLYDNMLFILSEVILVDKNERNPPD